MSRDESDEWTDIDDVECLASSSSSLKCRLIGTDRHDFGSFSLPRSVVNEEDSEVLEAGDIGVLTIASWKARDLGLD